MSIIKNALKMHTIKLIAMNISFLTLCKVNVLKSTIYLLQII